MDCANELRHYYFFRECAQYKYSFVWICFGAKGVGLVGDEFGIN